jgi:SAM-dependent methyltransferase
LDVPHATLYDDQFYDQQVAGSLASARIVLGALLDLTPVTSLIDIGCGVGPWLRMARDLGITDSLGLDGAYVDRSRLLVEPDRFQVCDLETPGLRTAVPHLLPVDVALCMEVAEHLAPARAPSFIAELCTLSDLVLFSAAVPGQGGTHHVNEQWPDYWSRHFAAAGFDCFDILRPRLWQEEACDWWYLQNALLFARRRSAAWAAIARSGAPTAAPLPLVHPRKLAQMLAKTAGDTAVIQGLRQEAAALDQQNRTASAALARQEAEREATFEATRLWMLRIERDLAAERETAVAAKAELRSLRQMLSEREAASQQRADALATLKGQLAAALDSYQAQQRDYRSLQTHHARLQAEHDALAARLRSVQAEQESLSRAAATAEATAKAVYASTSWRVTGPMRAVRRVLS